MIARGCGIRYIPRLRKPESSTVDIRTYQELALSNLNLLIQGQHLLSYCNWEEIF